MFVPVLSNMEDPVCDVYEALNSGSSHFCEPITVAALPPFGLRLKMEPAGALLGLLLPWFTVFS